MNQNQKGSSNIFLILAVIVVLAVAGLYLLKGRTTTSPTATNNIPTNQAIQSDSDLQSASQDLDNTNIDSTIDSELNKNTADASSF